MTSLNGFTQTGVPGTQYPSPHANSVFARQHLADIGESDTSLRLARDPARHVISNASGDYPGTINHEKPRYEPLSSTTERVLRLLLTCDLSRVRAESVAEDLGVSCTTLRRRLREDHTSYQFLLDRARQFRCESRLKERWLPGKCLADELGYLEINSFYRAFKRWTGLNYSEYRDVFGFAT